jgi:pimeloyl-ACP methyl ester carboxylesterase
MTNLPDVLAGTNTQQVRLDLAGVSTPVLIAGAGPPVVLLHGPGAYGSTWQPVIRLLARSHRVIAPDLPGHGASAVLSGKLDLPRAVTWLGDLVEQTCPLPAVVVGHLTGGALAARFAADNSHAVSRLVLVTPMGLAPFAPSPQFGAALTGYFGKPTADSHDALWRECVRDLDELRERMGERWEQMKLYNIDRASTPSVADAMGIFLDVFGMPTIPPDTLARIVVPTTLIWGRYDGIVRLSVGEAASERYGWPLRIIETGNEPALEAPEAFVQAAFGNEERA